MLSLKLFLLTIACFSAIASADPLTPNLVWTGDPDFWQSGFPAGTSESATPTDTGMIVEGSCSNSGASCNAVFSWDRPFTVTSGGTFELFGLGTDIVAANNCFSGYCSTAAVVSASFTTSGYAGLSDSSSAIDSDSTCAALGCNVSLTLSDTDSWLLTLAVGNYSLSETYLGYAEANGDISSEFQGSFGLVATPEPRADFVAVSLSFLVALLLKNRSRPHDPQGVKPRPQTRIGS